MRRRPLCGRGWRGPTGGGARAFAVDNADLEYVPLAALLEVAGDQVLDFRRPVMVQVEDAVDRDFEWLGIVHTRYKLMLPWIL